MPARLVGCKTAGSWSRPEDSTRFDSNAANTALGESAAGAWIEGLVPSDPLAASGSGVKPNRSGARSASARWRVSGTNGDCINPDGTNQQKSSHALGGDCGWQRESAPGRGTVVVSPVPSVRRVKRPPGKDHEDEGSCSSGLSRGLHFTGKRAAIRGRIAGPTFLL